MDKLESRKRAVAKIVRELKKLFPKTRIALNYSNNWELLVAVILSAQCTDKKVNEVTAKLFKKYKTLNDYIAASADSRTIKEFEQDIKPTGFYHSKAKYILESAKIIREKFHRRIPSTMEDLISLPGVARKTANIVLSNAYGIVEGIAVDTHVIRLSRLWNLTENTDPNKIERDLMEILPKKEWFYFTYRVIDYGRKYCPAGPHHRHDKCPLKKFHK